MYKLSDPFPHSFAGQLAPDRARGNVYSDSSLHIKDHRVSQLLVLLQRIQESTGGLGTLPEPQLTEIVTSAVSLCGFVNPVAAQDVIDTILESVEMEDSAPGSP
jgi:hypothetical protein